MVDSFNNTPYRSTPGIFENARNLRKRLTAAEKMLWEKLRNRKLNNLKFRRQHPISQYVADFYCAEHKVIVEIDGEIHDKAEQKERDQARTKDLEDLGIRLIRITNDEVLNDIINTLNKIAAFVVGRPG